MTSNRRRRSRYTPPSNRHRPHPGDDNPPPLYVIGWYDPDGNEIETVIDLKTTPTKPSSTSSTS